MKKFAVILASVLALGCCTTHKVSQDSILGAWSIESAMGVSTENAETPAFIEFHDGNKMNGNASVNSFNGSYSLKGECLKLSNVAMTKMMGASMEVEDAITNAINATASIRISGNEAVILNAQNDTIMTLKRK